MAGALPAGLHDLAAEVYHADPCPEPSLSAGLAWTMIDASPLHAWTASPRLDPFFVPTVKEAFDIGTAAHELLTYYAGRSWVRRYKPEMLLGVYDVDELEAPAIGPSEARDITPCPGRRGGVVYLEDPQPEPEPDEVLEAELVEPDERPSEEEIEAAAEKVFAEIRERDAPLMAES